RNVDGQLRPGMFVQTRVILAERAGALMVPEEALIAFAGEQRVYRVQGAKVEAQTGVTGPRRAGMVEIVSGVQAGALVVTAGHLRLRPGATVAGSERRATVAAPSKSAAPAGSRPAGQAGQERVLSL